MPSLALAHAPLQRPRTMSRTVDSTGKDAASALLGRALAVLRGRAGISQEAAGERAGISGQGWAKYENGRAPSIHFPDRQAQLTAALDATPADLEREKLILQGGGRSATVTDIRNWRQTSAPVEMIIRDRVRAGSWQPADDTDQGEPRRWPFARDPRFPHADQWLSEVVGDSVDRLGIFDGDLVHCVDVDGSGWSPQSGAIVEVERLRFDGSERELSLKQIELTPAGPLLWPRSSNPKWQEPLSMTDGASDDVVVRIRGLIVQSIRRF